MRNTPEAAAPELLPVPLVQAALLAMADPVQGVEDLPIATASGRVLSRQVVATCPVPPFDHAAMDGYALGPAGPGGRYHIAGRSAAGDVPAQPLGPGEAVRIFTGAPIPPGATAVLRQEDARAHGDLLEPGIEVRPGSHVRKAGEDVGAGEPVLGGGTLLDARHVALLAALGIPSVPVNRRVRVGLASTGSELVEVAAPRREGRIHDANRPLLAAALARPFVEIVDLGILRDDPDRLAATWADAAARCDALVTTGGTSVGDEDHLVDSVQRAGGHASVARLAVKPGKPAVFGSVGAMLMLGLPGNPVAALVSALLFVRPVIESLAGLPPGTPSPAPAQAGFHHPHPPGRLEFLPVRVTGRNPAGLPVLERLGPGGAARLRPLVEADGLAVVAAECGDVVDGGPVGFLSFAEALRF